MSDQPQVNAADVAQSAVRSLASPDQLALEQRASAPFGVAAKQLSEYDPSEDAAKLRALERGEGMPFNDREVDDAVLGTLIPAIRRNVEFQERFRDRLINEIKTRNDKYYFAAPEVNKLLTGVLGQDNAASWASAAQILGVYEAQRRRDRALLFDKKQQELYANVEKMHDTLSAMAASGLHDPAAIAKMAEDFDRKNIKAFGYSAALPAASANMITSLLAEGVVKTLGDAESRQKTYVALNQQTKNAVGQLQRSVSSTASTLAQYRMNRASVYAVTNNPVDVSRAQTEGFADPTTYRMFEIARATLGDGSEILSQMRQVWTAKNPRKAIIEAVQAGKLSPVEVYGAAVGLSQSLFSLLQESDVSRRQGVPNPNGTGISRPEFISLMGKLLPFTTEPVMVAHANTGKALLTVQAGLLQAPRDFREAVADADPSTPDGQAKLAQMLRAVESIGPSAQTLLNGLPSGHPVLATKALANMRAMLARSEHNLDNQLSLVESK